MIPVRWLDSLPAEAAVRVLTQCCGSSRWVRAMAAARPFGDEETLLAAVDRAFQPLTRDDWLEAFSHHPRIGDLASLRQRFAATAHLAGGEQSGVQGAGDEVLAALAAGNADYHKRYGFIFIVCATGKSAAAMLEILRSRLGNDPELELRIAAGEQRKITRIRLETLKPEETR